MLDELGDERCRGAACVGKEVEFQLEWGRVKIKSKFKLKKMVYDGNLEL